MDLFEEYLGKKETSEWVKRALTDTSYRNVDHGLTEKKTNADLATYGDAVIKLGYSELLLDKVKDLSDEKANYESDEYLVKTVAKHYDMLKHIRIDPNDKKIPTNYDYKKSKKTSSGKHKKHNPYKYIATAVEAMIGAIYKETNDLKPIIELLNSWRDFK